MTSLARTALPALLLFVPVTAVRAQSDRKTITGSDIAVFNIAGKVEVVAGTGSDVVVEVTRRGRDAGKLRVEIGEIRGHNTLRVVYPDDDVVYDDMERWGNSEFRIDADGTWGDTRGDRDDRDDRGRRGGHRIRVKSSGSGTHAWADLRVLVPTGKRAGVFLGVGELSATHVMSDLHLEAMSARIIATGTKGNLLVDNGSGGVEVRDATGDELEIETGSGGVTFSGVNGKRLKLDTGSGGITGTTLSADELLVNVGSGSIRIDDAKAARVKLDAGSGGIRFGLLTSPKQLDVDAGSGGVTISLPAALNAEIDVQTGSGGIDSDFPVEVTRMERHRLRGKVGDGSGRIRIESGSGTVRLRKV
jgi:hypothetical protein